MSFSIGHISSVAGSYNGVNESLIRSAITVPYSCKYFDTELMSLKLFCDLSAFGIDIAPEARPLFTISITSFSSLRIRSIYASKLCSIDKTSSGISISFLISSSMMKSLNSGISGTEIFLSISSNSASLSFSLQKMYFFCFTLSFLFSSSSSVSFFSSSRAISIASAYTPSCDSFLRHCFFCVLIITRCCSISASTAIPPYIASLIPLTCSGYPPNRIATMLRLPFSL